MSSLKTETLCFNPSVHTNTPTVHNTPLLRLSVAIAAGIHTLHSTILITDAITAYPLRSTTFYYCFQRLTPRGYESPSLFKTHTGGWDGWHLAPNFSVLKAMRKPCRIFFSIVELELFTIALLFVHCIYTAISLYLSAACLPILSYLLANVIAAFSLQLPPASCCYLLLPPTTPRRRLPSLAASRCLLIAVTDSCYRKFRYVFVTSGHISARYKFLALVFLRLFVIIAPADDQRRQPVPNTTRHVAILWRFLDISAQILCAHICKIIGGFTGILV